MADASVRPAHGGDAAEIARIQAAVWGEVHRGLLPAEELAELVAEVGSQEAADSWRDAASSPPTPRHRVLTALVGDTVVGFAALAPAADPDLDPATDHELLALCVDPAARGAGHGSRLVNAAADLAAGDGVQVLHTWLAPAETGLRAFLSGAGWAPDGAARSLDLRGDGVVVVQQVRLHAALVDPQ